MVAIKTSAGSAVKPQVPTPAEAEAEPTKPAKATKPTVATPGTPAPTPSPQAAIEAKVNDIAVNLTTRVEAMLIPTYCNASQLIGVKPKLITSTTQRTIQI